MASHIKTHFRNASITSFQAPRGECYIKIGDAIHFVCIPGTPNKLYVLNQDVVSRKTIPARHIFQLLDLVEYDGTDPSKQGKSFVYFKSYKHCEQLNYSNVDGIKVKDVWTYDKNIIQSNKNIKKRDLSKLVLLPSSNTNSGTNRTAKYVIENYQPLLRAVAFHATFNPFINRVWAVDMTFVSRSLPFSHRRSPPPRTPHPTPRQAPLAGVREGSAQESPRLSV